MALPRFTVRLAVAVCAAVALGGCRGAPPAETGLFTPAREASEALSLREARGFVLDLTEGPERSRVFEIVDGEHQGQRRRLTVRAEGSAIILESTLEGDERAESVERMRISERGDLVSERSVTRDREVITEFVPPLLLFPATLDPSAPAHASNAFIVHPIQDPERVKQRGDAKVTISMVGIERVSLEGGVVEAARVRSVLTIDFGVAAVERTTDQWFALRDGSAGIRGLVAERYDEVIKVLGVQTERRTGTMRAVP